MSTKIAIVTSVTSWFWPHSEQLRDQLTAKGYNAELQSGHEAVSEDAEIVFLLSYFRLVPKKFLDSHPLNLVVHESDLPKGKGWAPLFWQILEGKNEIPVVLFEADEKTDNGRIWLKDFIQLTGYELHDEIRQKQAEKTVEMCLKVLEEKDSIEPKEQEGEATFYEKRTPANSELDIHKTIDEQFQNLRIASNEDYPAFFIKDGKKYILKIEEEE